ncbi:MAG: tRNA preQ1(34) S-adenosylmethionine ribosyltransferase-isomerase QueA [Gammaproteobacteria bacterium]|nr:tRNA preQ1(34) S-adenosylmethionine ribosyltransferase-isomerase QueA [Gammaproteobacteria bacterium]
MKVSEFSYELPDELIADYPSDVRTSSRLLCLNSVSGEMAHKYFTDLLNYLRPNDLLVFNNTKVIPARFFGEKETGGKIEILVERIMSDNCLLAQIKASKSPKIGSKLFFYAKNTEQPEDSLVATVLDLEEGFFKIQFGSEISLSQSLFPHGYMPLPPYIRRQEEALDLNRYQTIYATKEGAVAAPTAGLHFDRSLISNLVGNGINTAFLTLHVGAGTFQPVRVKNLEEHRMHREFIELDASVCNKVEQCREKGGRVIAVGTTSVRCLESAVEDGRLKATRKETAIFIYPGYKFQIVDAMITNFHLPESTLLMLVSAFSSKKVILDAYAEAIRQRYRFFSYGDAMFIY